MNFTDYYKLLELNHEWSCAQILQHLRNILKQWKKRNNSCSSDKKEQLELISNMLKYITEAMSIFKDDMSREKYDKELNEAYSNGHIDEEIIHEYEDLLEKADHYYLETNNVELALEYARQAVDAQINNIHAYELLADCCVLVNDYISALTAIDKGLNVFPKNISLMQKAARIATISGNMFGEAQKRTNLLIENYPNYPIGFAEQIFMHLTKRDFQLAFSEVDSYIAARPSDMAFRKIVAYDLIKFIQDNYLYPTDNNPIIAGKEAYQVGLKLSNKALSIYNDEYIKNVVEYMEYFGKREFDKWNLQSIKTLTIYGAILCVIPPIGILFLIIDVLLVVFSFRPYWQINETHITGRMGQLETIVHNIGYYAANLSRKSFNLLKKLFLALIKFVVWIATGGPFRG